MRNQWLNSTRQLKPLTHYKLLKWKPHMSQILFNIKKKKKKKKKNRKMPLIPTCLARKKEMFLM
jgi:hypothetical protein